MLRNCHQGEGFTILLDPENKKSFEPALLEALK